MYSIFPINDTPQFLLDRHHNPAKYGEDDKFYVFGDDDIVIDETDDIKSKGFNHQFKEGNKGLTVAQLKANVNSRISNQQSFKLTESQGRYMWGKEWKPKQTEK